MSTFDRIQEVQQAMLPERLRRGAQTLGELWRSGQRCRGGWSGYCDLEEHRIEKQPFCIAKARWVGLLKDFYGGWPYELTGREPYAVIEAMKLSWFEGSGLTAAVEIPNARCPVKFGKHGTHWWTLLDLVFANEPEEIEAVIKIQEAMPT